MSEPRWPFIAAAAILIPAILQVSPPASAAEPETVDRRVEPLWPDGAPEAKGSEPADIPAISIMTPDGPRSGAAVIVCPGGGYWVHAIDHEGRQVGHWLNSLGVTAFVLQYRLKDRYEPRHAFMDAQRALRYVRHHADRFDIDPHRLGILGFSAGGHLASATSVNFDPGNPNADDPVNRHSSRPDFAILCYAAPGPTTQWGEEKPFGRRKPTADTPPTFLWVTQRDRFAAEGVEYYQLLHEADVEAELHVFGGWGPHGTGLAPGEPTIGHWPDLAADWMRKTGLLTDQPRLKVTGRITLDGQPLNRGWITFIPTGEGAQFRPIVATHISHNDDGRYELPAADGPVPGSYRVEIRRTARSFDTTPSIDRAELYKHATPDADQPLRARIEPDTDNQIDFTITTE